MNAVEVVRGGTVESRHRVHVVVADRAGAVHASLGDPSTLTFHRSAAKPMQALPLVEEGVADRIGLTDAELALCCASHEGEAEHVRGARSILARAGAEESLLRCGAHAPYSARAAGELAASGAEPAGEAAQLPLDVIAGAFAGAGVARVNVHGTSGQPSVVAGGMLLVIIE